MKGVPDAPRCGFSNAVVQIMRMHAVPYDSHDVLADEAIRQADAIAGFLWTDSMAVSFAYVAVVVSPCMGRSAVYRGTVWGPVYFPVGHLREYRLKE
ncbi:Glutaredoxin-related protein 5, mitochondrial [Eumeta japonica]|uniref:Glutaredoxin-related protein 5, mitochondrial n=1 Tax=Eumeta variegata TaxID=151549 RepID=A0A4C1WE56_EUMVA|nr:Glutaredoxin-related protein 5, mitochondrial [Eumeta japonica]